MKRFLSMALCIVMALGILAGCGQKGNDPPKNDDNSTALSGSVSTNGSTSMDKVIGDQAPAETIAGGFFGSVREDGSLEVELQAILGATNEPPISAWPPGP